jgi:hypothetical protein
LASIESITLSFEKEINAPPLCFSEYEMSVFQLSIVLLNSINAKCEGRDFWLTGVVIK